MYQKKYRRLKTRLKIPPKIPKTRTKGETQENDPSLAIRYFLCGIASVLPDALETPHIFTDTKYNWVEKLTQVQKKLQTQAPLPWGILTQVVIVAVCLLVAIS